MRGVVAASVLLLARAVLAHDVPVNPSTCLLDTVALDAPVSGEPPVVEPPAGTDTLRVVYGVATSTAQFQQPAQSTRGFTAAGQSGALGLPLAFDATLLSSGDLRAEQVAVEVSVGGGTVRVPIRLTTGLGAQPGAVLAGLPIQPSGRFEMVGAIPSGLLQPALDGVGALRFGCQLQPVPDLDRFASAPAVESLAGSLSPRGGSLRGVLRGGPALGALGSEPVLLEVRANGLRAAIVNVPDGFAGAGRHRVAESSDGSRVTLRRGADRDAARLQVRLAAVALPAALAGPVDVRVTLVTGTVTARGAATFRARGGAVRAGS